MAKIISSIEQTEDKALDLTLRPRSLDEFVGQENIKEQLKIFIGAARERGEPLEHVLLYGNPGLGKTTLAHIIAGEVGANIRVTSGPALERVGDLAAILTNLENNDILFIDEIHRMNKTIEEVMYPAMEEYALDIVIGKGPSARTLRLDLPHFTIIGATTRLSLLSSPLRDRFGTIYHLNYYSVSDIIKIVKRSAKIFGVNLDEEASGEIAKRSRNTPRVANRLLKRVRDYAQVKKTPLVSKNVAVEALNMLEVDAYGLDAIDRRILETIISKFKGGPVGLGSLSAATQEEVATIEEVYEPFLLQAGLLNRTPRGRVATEAAYKHLNIKLPDDLQKLLI